MHASRGWPKSFTLVLAALSGAPIVSAGPAVRRAITESALDPWVSILPNGNFSTITPVLTTINGAPTTINPIPDSLVATTTTTDASAATSTSGTAAPTQPAAGAFKVCHNLDGPFAPFCQPDNGTDVWVDNTYYVTWDSSYFDDDEPLLIQANYVNASGGGPQAFQSVTTPNSWGGLAWSIKTDWLQSEDSNNITLFITAQNRRSIAGPTVRVTTKPTPPANIPSKTPPPQAKDLYIALPAVAGFILLCLCGGFIFNRKHRKIGLGNVMGRRKGYGVGKSRRQRLGLSKKPGAIRLRDQELRPDGQYRDRPIEQRAGAPGHRRDDSDGLGSLVGTPTEDGPRGGNIFRDELRRQEHERY